MQDPQLSADVNARIVQLIEESRTRLAKDTQESIARAQRAAKSAAASAVQTPLLAGVVNPNLPTTLPPSTPARASPLGEDQVRKRRSGALKTGSVTDGASRSAARRPVPDTGNDTATILSKMREAGSANVRVRVSKDGDAVYVSSTGGSE